MMWGWVPLVRVDSGNIAPCLTMSHYFRDISRTTVRLSNVVLYIIAQIWNIANDVMYSYLIKYRIICTTLKYYRGRQ